MSPTPAPAMFTTHVSPMRRTIALVSATVLAALSIGTGATVASAADGPTLLSQGKTATASSAVNGGSTAAQAVDGDIGTRWESVPDVDPQWIQVDLDSVSVLDHVVLYWEGARASQYTVEVSADGDDWATAYTATVADPEIPGAEPNKQFRAEIDLEGVDARYVRVNGTERAIGYGYSLWEFEVYGTAGEDGGDGGDSGDGSGDGPVSIYDGTGVVGLASTGADSWQLQVDDAPYTIKGLTWGPTIAGAGAVTDQELDSLMEGLVDAGVNTIRTWGTDASSARLFDAARDHGIRTIAGFWVQPGGGPGSGGCPDFVDGTDPYFQDVLDDIETYVNQYKGHDGVLMWDVGNESILGLQNCYTGTVLEDQRVAYAQFINDATELIHSLDADHPVTSTDAYTGAWPYLRDHAPALDLLAINAYKDVTNVHDAWLAGGYGKPYIITEAGPDGEWEVPDDANGAPTEPTDVQKAAGYTRAWEAVTDHPSQALGATMFHYGTENDMGGVWLNVLTDGDKRLSYYAVADAYGGAAASGNRSPEISAMTVPAGTVVPGATFTISGEATDPDADPIAWSVEQSANYVTGTGALVAADATETGAGTFDVVAPEAPGVWKFYLKARDGQGNVGIETRTVNVALGGENLALGKTATASTMNPWTDNYSPGQAVDGDGSTRWGSGEMELGGLTTDEWFQVDLGAATPIDSVRLQWETAFASAYSIQVSDAESGPWTDVATVTNGDGGLDELTFDSTTARYVRMQSVTHATEWGVSLWEFGVYNSGDDGSGEEGSGGEAQCVPLTATGASASSGDAAPTIDGIDTTRWESAWGNDAEWLQIDLGASTDVCGVSLNWEGAFATDYNIEVSTDGDTWSTALEVRGNTVAGPVDLTFDAPVTARYVRMQGVTRVLQAYGYSVYEFQAIGTEAALPEPDPVDPDPTHVTVPGDGADLVCGRDLVQGASVTATASHGNGDDAVNGNVWARWDSGTVETPSGSNNWEGRDGEWLEIDLGDVEAVCGIKPTWEAAYAADYDVEVSTNGTDWHTAAEVRGVTGSGPHVTRFDPVSARYVKITSVTRGTQFGLSMWDLEIFEPRNIDLPVTDLLGDKVVVFDPAMDGEDIQAILDSTFADQETDQFGEGRWQFMFLPGDYTVDARLGFYTSLSGAGLDPTDVTITGGDWVDAEWFDMNATQNFWRSAENLAWNPTDGLGRWAVAQAAPFRRIAVNGDLQMDSGRYGWASGGYIADSKITGTAMAYTQQQWYTRDSSLGKWDGAVWNAVLSGVEGEIDASSWPDPPVTSLASTGTVAEKPYLYFDGTDAEAASDWLVRVPEVRSGTTGVTWADGPTPGRDVSLTEFFIAKEGDTAAQINSALASGKNVLFTPGVYRMDQTIEVTNPDTVVLGLGLATIIPTGGGVGMHVADADGIRVAGLLFDAAVAESPALFVVGDKGAHTDHSANPVVLSDVFMRVGGAVAGKVDAAMIVNADDTIVDHVWSWRGDHGAGIGWDLNTSDYGFVVNGDNVSAYGLFVEHYQKYNTLWNGNGGRTVFYQNELAYDVPSQEAWQNGNRRGFAAYKVAEDVTTHEAWGLGSYSNFLNHADGTVIDGDDDYCNVDGTDSTIIQDNAFEVPQTAGVVMHHMATVSLGGKGTYQHVINGVGDIQCSQETSPSYVEIYPTGGDDPAFDPIDPVEPEGPGDGGTDGTGGTGGTGGDGGNGGTDGTGGTGTDAPDSDSEAAAVVLSSGIATAGEDIEVTATGYQPGERVRIELHSEPVVLATVTADASGAIAKTVTIPLDTSAGQHHVVVTGMDSEASASAALTVVVAGDQGGVGGGLAVTGSSVGLVALLTLILLGGGLGLRILGRRQQARSA